MFDPTAFENMKVVLEGIIYDRDFEGSILVTDRQDLVNISSLSRSFLMEMELKNGRSTTCAPIKCSISLEAGLKNLSAELLEYKGGADAGCHIETIYQIPLKDDKQADSDSLFRTLSNIWGSSREIEITEKHIYRSPEQSARIIMAKVVFGRLVTEEQIPDFTDLVDHAIISINELEHIYSD
ncbi:hypothetical protein V1498_08390 [Peribacillus sp. SCS-26]|uniref:hypothetical protein n=1 Tax=Paraperibacillus marinus TaxID=3115295 RepID=UPI003905F0DE